MSRPIDLVAFRRELHAHPETAGEERETAQRVLDVLRPLKPDEVHTGLGGHGILATFGTDVQGPQVMVRCELDALAIEEVNDFAHRSTRAGKSHKCGHDGHMAIVTALAEKLSAERPSRGRVHLLYQPAEENGAGAHAVLQDRRMHGRRFDLVLALHNLPGHPMGSVVVRAGAFTASVNSMVIKLTGRTSHAAEPEHGVNPALAVAEILQQALALQHNDPSADGLRVVTVVHINLGSPDYGISAGHAEIHLTVRCWTDGELEQLQAEIEALARAAAGRHALGVEVEYCFTFKANVNDADAAALVEQAAKATGHALVPRSHPFKWGEDFGLFTARYKGCMFGLGAGMDTPALHNPDYDFPDELIPQGAELFHAAIGSFLAH